MLAFLEVARELSLEAGRRLMTLRESPLVRQRKPDHSLVTNADHEADRILREGLIKAFPDHSVLTEESGLKGPSNAEYVWIVDPLDGTTAYAKGIPGFSVMVGLLKRGLPFAGVVVDPLEGHCYEAQKGEGSFHTYKGVRTQVHVAARNDFSDMPIITSTGFPEPIEKALKQVLPNPWIPSINSVGIKVGYVVRQLADIYINHHWVHYWDTCAPQIILEEAGGEMTFIDGSKILYVLERSSYRHEGPTLATNAVRHQEVLDVVRSAMRPPHSPVPQP